MIVEGLAETGHAAGAVDAPALFIDDFADFFKVHYPRLVRALVLSGARTAAEDIAQEAFARTFTHWRRVKGGVNPPGYVYRIAFRLSRGMVPATPLDDTVVGIADAADAVSTRVDLERALAAMPPRRRACVVLCWLLEVPPVEAADALGIAPGTVRKQLDLARRQVSAVTD